MVNCWVLKSVQPHRVEGQQDWGGSRREEAALVLGPVLRNHGGEAVQSVTSHWGSGWGPRRADQDSGAWMGPWESKTQAKGAPRGGSRWVPGWFS